MAYLDNKIDLLMQHSGGEPDRELLTVLVEDLRLCHDAVRTRADVEEEEVYRGRTNKLLVVTNLLRRHADGKSLEYLDALEGVLLGVMRGDHR